jgi:hypothetical protein
MGKTERAGVSHHILMAHPHSLGIDMAVTGEPIKRYEKAYEKQGERCDIAETLRKGANCMQMPTAWRRTGSVTRRRLGGSQRA